MFTSKFFQDTLTGVKLQLVEPSGQVKTEYISLKLGESSRLGSSDNTEFQLEGLYVAPVHVLLSHDRHNAFLEVCNEGFPLLCNGRLYGRGEKIIINDFADIMMGNMRASLSTQSKKEAKLKRIGLIGGFILIIIALLLNSALSVQNRIIKYHTLIKKSYSISAFEEKISTFKDAKNEIGNSYLATWFTNKDEFKFSVTEALSRQYYNTPCDSTNKRSEIIANADILDVEIPDLKILCQTELWLKKTVDLITPDSNPVFKIDPKNALIRECQDVVDLVTQTEYLRNRNQSQSALILIHGSAVLQENKKHYSFFKPFILRLYSNVLKHQADENKECAFKPDRLYLELDPELKYVTPSYLKMLEKYDEEINYK